MKMFCVFKRFPFHTFVFFTALSTCFVLFWGMHDDDWYKTWGTTNSEIAYNVGNFWSTND